MFVRIRLLEFPELRTALDDCFCQPVLSLIGVCCWPYGRSAVLGTCSSVLHCLASSVTYTWIWITIVL